MAGTACYFTQCSYVECNRISFGQFDSSKVEKVGKLPSSLQWNLDRLERVSLHKVQ